MGQTNARVRRWLALPFACALIGVGLSSCNGDKSDGNGPVGAGDCQALMSAYCTKYAACDPTGFRRDFGDAETCRARQTLVCAGLTLPGTAWTSGKIQQCTAQINASTSCYDDVFESDACDDLPGELSDGTPCEQSSQCAGRQCSRPSVVSPDGGFTSPSCGVCAGQDAGTPTPRCGDGGSCPSPCIAQGY